MNEVSISAIMAVRDGERYLAEALDSIIGQSVPPTEIVVVNDGSTDGTAALLESYGDAIRVVLQAPSGHATAINTGIAHATGALFAFLDSDDLWEPESISCRLAHFHDDDAPDAVFGRIVQFVSPDLGPDAISRFRFDPGPSRADLFQAMLIRREAWERVGLLDTTLPSAANIDWMGRARQAGLRSEHIDNVVARRRLHRTNMGVTMGVHKLKNLTDVVRAHRDRARASAPTDPPASPPSPEGTGS